MRKLPWSMDKLDELWHSIKKSEKAIGYREKTMDKVRCPHCHQIVDTKDTQEAVYLADCISVIDTNSVNIQRLIVGALSNM
jgi:hypothetical protein